MINFFFGAFSTLIAVSLAAPFFVEPKRKRGKDGRFVKRGL